MLQVDRHLSSNHAHILCRILFLKKQTLFVNICNKSRILFVGEVNKNVKSYMAGNNYYPCTRVKLNLKPS